MFSHIQSPRLENIGKIDQSFVEQGDFQDPGKIFNSAVAFIATLLVMTLLLSSCAALDFVVATPEPPTGTPLPSPTYDWFPVSDTPTIKPLITLTATPEMRPGLGRILLTDDFSNSGLWSLAVSDQASADIEDKRLTIGVQPGTYMLSLRRDRTFDDFYAEITAQPSLCKDGDDYGLLVRGTSVAHYRFVLSCNGMVKADRASLEERHVLQEAVPSGDVPAGAPGEVRIGLWAVGTEMRLFLNGKYQFEIRDANYGSGLIGVFVRAAGDTPATVSFSDLSIRQVTASNPPPSAMPNQ